MHPASHKVLLLVLLSLSGGAQAAVQTLPPSTPPSLVEAKNASSMNSPPTKPIVAKPSADVVKVAVPVGSPGAVVQPSPSVAAGASASAPTGSPWRAWQPPLAAAVLMLVIALKRQGGSS